jgi:hypothetical protein
MNTDDVVGVAPYGATTIAGGDGKRQPSLYQPNRWAPCFIASTPFCTKLMFVRLTHLVCRVMRLKNIV